MLMFGMGALLKAERERRGMSIAELSTKMNYAASDIEKIESGRSLFPVRMTDLWAHALGIDPDIVIAEMLARQSYRIYEQLNREPSFKIVPNHV